MALTVDYELISQAETKEAHPADRRLKRHLSRITDAISRQKTARQARQNLQDSLRVFVDESPTAPAEGQELVA